MKKRFSIHPWKIIESYFDPLDLRFSESLMAAGNGAMGLRGNIEEDFSGDSHRGTYVGGVWFPDKTRVGWWKVGYPQYFGKAINAMNLIGVHVRIDGVNLDANCMPVEEFYRELDMQTGILLRRMTYKTVQGYVHIQCERFVSMNNKALLAIEYTITPDYPAVIEAEAYLDGNVHNEDSNFDEHFWEMEQTETMVDRQGALLLTRTRENPFGTPRFAVAGAFRILGNMHNASQNLKPGYAAIILNKEVKGKESARLCKMVCIATDRDYLLTDLAKIAKGMADNAAETGYEKARHLHIEAWLEKWAVADVEIKGDESAQQGIRFNLFQMLCTYTGEDARLNIGPKGFTGEKYGGATYWDTEAFCFPVYMAISGEKVAKQLLLYRHRQLPGAFLNATQQGLPGALFPMVTFNGIECHNEWEITFEEIHRNAAIAHAIFNYVSYTGDEIYLQNEGLDVLCGIARFWAGRVHLSSETNQYMLHGVTGPNEYENNVSNNWYTNRMASWCLEYFCDATDKASSEKLEELVITPHEIASMRNIVQNMYYPYSQKLNVFVQHDTFLDKDIKPAKDIYPSDLPINQHWSWDRILRSPYIKQADVLQGMYFLGHLYDIGTKKRNFDFYEPLTVHESSLSPSVHAVLAAEIGYRNKAMEMYHRTARLDLDNLNNDTKDGLHITSMSGSWLSIAQGFAGMRTVGGLCFSPFLPDEWEGYSFQFSYRGRVIRLEVNRAGIMLQLHKGEPLDICLYNNIKTLRDELCLRMEEK